MTLVIGLKTKDGIVIASDSQATSDLTSNDKVQKIFAIGGSSAVGISGDGGLATYFLDQIKEELNYSQGILHLAEEVRQKGKAKFNDFFEHLSPEKRPKLSLVLVGYSKEGNPEIYTLRSEDNFVPRKCVIGYECIGVPYIADYILTGLYETEIKMNAAAEMAVLCIEETARQGGSGVGGETKVAIIDAATKTFKQMPKIDVERMREKAKQFQIVQKSRYYPEDPDSGTGNPTI
ncbi:MAG: hypothetical protein A2908_02990 [Candidatus Staskawiczbacteria bacterium RIFCSPLOWO2_01_FULL_38_12b]|uniref:Proteasome endopeptidase complex n=1 Tax=Candidatus Staskawiczbacteria bacterium RIFCSPLOWO2_01_FULL_38_12b TaxID=1802214 RepID=A0A1G2ICC8_9BACT|nr:MAG: hypothetical protein A2908_02990 [Candidatus Staskawiczbacteria bacterium RIFCSPLOWO2_01_FULL_38_12b]QBM02576.1 hypothetical protein [uncultured archaeon]